jgi:predicted permease
VRVILGDEMQTARFRFWLWLIALVGVIVPRRLRADWRQEWEAELRYREELLAEWDRLGWRGKLDLLRRSTSAFWDALWLQPRRLEDEMFQDLRFGLRMMLKSRVVTIVALLSLALGIGANTAIFSLVDAVLLKTLPVKEPERLVLFRWHSGPRRVMGRVSGEFDRDQATGVQTSTSFSYLTFERLREGNRTLAGVLAFTRAGPLNVNVDGEPEVASGQLVSGGYYAGLGVRTLVGRGITSDDDKAAAEPVAVISHRYWQNRFGLDPAIVGKTINVNNTPVTIIGVTPNEFRGTLQVGSNPDLSLPLALEPQIIAGRRAEPWLGQTWIWWLQIIGRLKPGVSVEQARADLEVIFQRAALEGYQAMPANWIGKEPPDIPRFDLSTGSQGLTESRKKYAQSLQILMVIVGLTLLVACANVANLLLARSAARQGEMAVRLAVGASRFRLVRQLLTESVLLAFIGGALGLLFAYWGKDALLALRPWGGGTLSLDLKLDLRMLGFTAAVSALTGILFGLAPALRATRVELNASLKDGTGTGGGSRSTLSKGLVVTQVSLSLVLLAGAGLFIRTLRNLQNVEIGFNRENMLLFRADPRISGHKDEQIANVYQQMLERLRAIPGVRQASFAHEPPLIGGFRDRIFTVLGRAGQSNQSDVLRVLLVEAKFFETIEIPLLLGRSLTELDNASALKVAIVNQAFARRFFPDENPIGNRLFVGQNSNPQYIPSPDGLIEIVGVVRDAKYYSQREEITPVIFLPAVQNPMESMAFAVRTAGDPLAMIPAIREAVRQIDRNLPLSEFMTVNWLAEERLVQERLFAYLTTFFGLLALLLVGIGLYGVMAYSVTQRTREIGVRMALGARAADVLRLFIRQGMLIVAIGVAIGLGGAVALTRLMSSWLFDVSPTDPVTFACVALLLLMIALFACWLPARRAAKVDPIRALRHE